MDAASRVLLAITVLATACENLRPIVSFALSEATASRAGQASNCARPDASGHRLASPALSAPGPATQGTTALKVLTARSRLHALQGDTSGLQGPES